MLFLGLGCITKNCSFIISILMDHYHQTFSYEYWEWISSLAPNWTHDYVHLGVMRHHVYGNQGSCSPSITYISLGMTRMQPYCYTYPLIEGVDFLVCMFLIPFTISPLIFLRSTWISPLDVWISTCISPLNIWNLFGISLLNV